VSKPLSGWVTDKPAQWYPSLVEELRKIAVYWGED